ncbi:hypothetical protein QU38_01585, partial [Staphylococcus aureus]
GEEIGGQDRADEDQREDPAHQQEGIRRRVLRAARDQARQHAGKEHRGLPGQDPRAGEAGAGAVIIRHLGGERLVRDQHRRIDDFEEHIGGEIVEIGLAAYPHQREAGHQRQREEQEHAPPAEPPGEPAVADRVRDMADEGTAHRIE